MYIWSCALISKTCDIGYIYHSNLFLPVHVLKCIESEHFFGSFSCSLLFSLSKLHRRERNVGEVKSRIENDAKSIFFASRSHSLFISSVSFFVRLLVLQLRLSYLSFYLFHLYTHILFMIIPMQVANYVIISIMCDEPNKVVHIVQLVIFSDLWSFVAVWVCERTDKITHRNYHFKLESNGPLRHVWIGTVWMEIRVNAVFYNAALWMK